MHWQFIKQLLSASIDHSLCEFPKVEIFNKCGKLKACKWNSTSQGSSKLKHNLETFNMVLQIAYWKQNLINKWIVLLMPYTVAWGNRSCKFNNTPCKTRQAAGTRWITNTYFTEGVPTCFTFWKWRTIEGESEVSTIPRYPADTHYGLYLDKYL